MWPGVEEMLTTRSDGGRDGMEVVQGSRGMPSAAWKSRSGRNRGWLVPTLAAASLTLLFSTGFLMLELRSTRVQVQQLADRADLLSEWTAKWGDGARLVERTARLADGRRGQGRALELAFLGQEDIRLGSLVELLRGVPEDRVLFDASRIETLRRLPTGPHPELRHALTVLDQAVRELGGSGGIRAGDLAEWLATSDLPADLALPKSPIIDILS